MRQESSRDPPKSSLLTNNKTTPQVEFIQNHQINDYVASLSDEDQEAEFQRQFQQYHKTKRERKREVELHLRREFGSEDSDDQDFSYCSSMDSSAKFASRGYSDLSPKNEPITTGKLHQYPIYWQSEKEGWAKDSVIIGTQILKLPRQEVMVKNIDKVKVTQGVVVNQCHKVKISYNHQSEQTLLCASNKQQLNALPICYLVFAGLITQKLKSQGVKLGQNVLNSIPGLMKSMVEQSHIYGKLLKKSQHLGKWEERLVIINQEGIYSYKSMNQKHTMFIPAEGITELWTRFEVIEEMLNIKVMYNSTKTEFGIPLLELLSNSSWLYHFYQLLMKNY